PRRMGHEVRVGQERGPPHRRQTGGRAGLRGPRGPPRAVLVNIAFTPRSHHQAASMVIMRPMSRLSQVFMPKDREFFDLFEEVADYLGLYKIQAPMEQAQRLAHILLQSCRQIAEAMPRLRDFKDMDHYTIEIHRLENDGDRIVREAVASLFEGGIDPMVVI